MSYSGIGIGIIGPGAIADVHAKALKQLGVPVVAAAGPEPADLEEFAATHAVPGRYSGNAELLADPRVDAVIVAAPSSVHAAITREALHAGKHVLCEVPLAMSHSDGVEVVSAAEAAGLILAVAHTLRFWQPHRELSRALQGAGHPPTQVIVRSLMLRQSDTGWTGKTRSWTDNVVWHHGSHSVDAALWFLGEPVVSAEVFVGDSWSVNGTPMDVSVLVRAVDGRIGTVSLSYHSRVSKSDALVITEHDTFELTGARLYRNDELVFDGGEIGRVQFEAVVAQDKAFLDAIRGDTEDGYFGTHALPTLAVLGGEFQGSSDATPSVRPHNVL